MGVVLPQVVADFLGMIGVKFPNVDEDKLNDLAGHLRDFADGIDGTSAATTAHIEAMGDVYQGASYQALSGRWQETSLPHVRRVTGDLGRAAGIMDGAAEFIRVRKLTAIGQLGLLAEDWFADQAAAVETGGLTEGLAAMAEAAAWQLVRFLGQEVLGVLMGDVLDKALNPLLESVAKGAQAWVLDEVRSLESEAAGGPGAPSVLVDQSRIRAHTDAVRGHADTLRGHVEALNGKLDGWSLA